MVLYSSKLRKVHTEYQPGEDEVLDAFLDSRPVMGLVYEEKIELVERLQCLVRGHIARKRVQNIKSLRALMELPRSIVQKHPDYCNPDVQELLRREPAFDYGTVTADGVKRVWRPMQTVGKDRYEGQWNEKTGGRDGMGMLIRPDGTVHVGFWKDNRANGRGRVIMPNKEIYVGDFNNDVFEGFGVYKYADGSVYEGNWS